MPRGVLDGGAIGRGRGPGAQGAGQSDDGALELMRKKSEVVAGDGLFDGGCYALAIACIRIRAAPEAL